MAEDRTKALEIMNLPEDATDRDVEIRYVSLLRRVKGGEELDIEQINWAYNILLNITTEKTHESKFRKRYKKFMFHHLGITAVLALVTGITLILVMPILTRRVPDLSVSFVGNFNIFSNVLEQRILDEMPHLEHLIVETIFFGSGEGGGDLDAGGRIRLAGLIIGNDAGLFIASDAAYNFMLSNEVLIPLDGILEELGLVIPREQSIFGVDPEDSEVKVFGINVSDNPLVFQSVHGSLVRILCLSRGYANRENVLEAMRILLSEEGTP